MKLKETERKKEPGWNEPDRERKTRVWEFCCCEMWI